MKKLNEEQIYHRLCSVVRMQNPVFCCRAALAFLGVLIRSITDMQFKVVVLRSMRAALDRLISEQPADVQAKIMEPLNLLSTSGETPKFAHVEPALAEPTPPESLAVPQG